MEIIFCPRPAHTQITHRATICTRAQPTCSIQACAHTSYNCTHFTTATHNYAALHASNCMYACVCVCVCEQGLRDSRSGYYFMRRICTRATTTATVLHGMRKSRIANHQPPTSNRHRCRRRRSPHKHTRTPSCARAACACTVSVIILHTIITHPHSEEHTHVRAHI